MIYLSEMQRENLFWKKILQKIKYFFNIIDIKNNEGKIIYFLPIYSNKKTKKHKVNLLSKKIIEELKNEDSVVLSKTLQEINYLKNILLSHNINILDGRYLFKCLNFNIIQYIFKLKNSSIEHEEIWILVNNLNYINKQIINDIAKKAKTLNIVTKNIGKLKKSEDYLFEEYGVLLNISDNKKNSLLKATFILNLDFSEEIFNQYRIYNKAIIINLSEKIEIKNKKFNGINVNYFKINMPIQYNIYGFKNEEIYESFIYKMSFKEIQEKLQSDKVEIKNLIGSRGIIEEQEFIKN